MKRFTLLALLAVLVLLVGACAAPAAQPVVEPPAAEAPPAAEPAGPRAGGTLSFAMKEDVTSLDPLKAIQYGDIRLNILVAQQLVAPERAAHRRKGLAARSLRR
jgi:ABC-type transport system substrate-binding protein